jgi:hypothetical protein
MPLTDTDFSADAPISIALVSSSVTQSFNGNVAVTNSIEVYQFNSASIPWTITGSVTINNQPNITVSASIGSIESVGQGTSGSVPWKFIFHDGINEFGTSPLFPFWTTGSITIDNFPEVQAITGSVIVPNIVTVTGTIVQENYQVTQSVKIDQSILLPVSISNLYQTQNITGSVAVINFPINQLVSQFNSGSIPWKFIYNDGTKTYGTSSINPIFISGSTKIDPSNNAIGSVRITDMSGSDNVNLIFDTTDQIHRLAVSAKVSITPPQPPASAIPIQINADTPLNVSSTITSSYLIPSGSVFHMQQVTAGSEGDPNEKGSKVEVYYSSSISGEKIIERIYINGFSQFGSYPDTAFTRDGTAMSGSNSGRIIVKRIRLGGQSLEIDCVVRGFLG